MGFEDLNLDFQMTIGGARVGSPDRVPVTNPATGRQIGSVPDCERAQLDQAMAAAQGAVGWGDDDAGRRAVLAEAADALEAATDELAGIDTAEQGKPTREARAEVGECVKWMRYYATLEVTPETITVDRAQVAVQRRPVGVVAAITPWNFPLSTAFWKIAPALRAGNAVVLKPSPFTPLSPLRAVELLNDVLPAGVLNAVSGGDELGAWMTNHPTPRLISFTGSTDTGKQIAAAGASDLKRLVLELGGNDPALLLDDVDVDALVRPIFWGAFYNCGQVCAGIKRVYAPRALHDALVEGLAAYADSLAVGDGSVDGVRIGPINNEPQLERVRGLVADALDRGARVATGDHDLPSEGYFHPATILADAPPTAKVVVEEQFGPALPVIPYDSLDDAVEWANGTRYGLGASVWSADTDRARAIAPQLRSGTTWINTHTVLPPEQPFAGCDWSGLGVENGLAGLQALTVPQVIHEPAR